ncbi:MAG: ribokinase [Acidimicrobiia bacterium]
MAKVIVIGSINMDIVASAARHPKLGETVQGSSLQFIPGGKGANQAVAAARAGAETALIGSVGDDRFAGQLTSFLDGAGVSISAVRVVAGAPTGAALIIVDANGENSIVVVSGANGHLDAADVDSVRVERDDIVVAQLEVPTSTVVAAFERARAQGATTVLNPTPAQAMIGELDHLVDVLVVNENELNTLAGSVITATSTVGEIRAALSVLGGARGRTTVATLGARGAVAVTGDRLVEVAGQAVEAVDTTGAGDCFVGALAARLAAGTSLVAALEFANVAASICVERVGAGPSMPTFDEIRERGS